MAEVVGGAAGGGETGSGGGGGGGGGAPGAPGATGEPGAAVGGGEPQKVGAGAGEGEPRKVAPIPENRLYKVRPSKVPGLVEAEDDEGAPEPAKAAPDKKPEPPAKPEPEKKAEPGDADHKALVEGDIAALDTPEKVIHTLKTLKGMHRSMLSKVEEATKNQEAAFTRAQEWYQEAQRKDAEIAQLRQQIAQGAAPAAAAPAAGGPGGETAAKAIEDEFGEAMDWSTYWALANSQNPQDRLAAPMVLASELVKFVNGKFNGALDTRFKPMEQASQVSQAQHVMTEMFASLAATKLADGSLAYPELNDDATATQVGALWASLGYPTEWLAKPAGLHMAVLEYRHRKGLLGPAAAPAGNAAPLGGNGNGEAAVDHSAAAAAAAAAVLSGGGVPATRPGGPLSTAQAVAASIASPVKFAAHGILP